MARLPRVVGRERDQSDAPGPEQDGSSIEQHSLARSVALHLLPGTAIAAIFYAAAPVVMRAGYPAIAAGILAGAVGILGAELAFLLHQARRRSGRWSLGSILPYRPGPFTWPKVLLVLALVAWAIVTALVVGGLRPTIIDTLFPWLPEWAINPLPSTIATTVTRTALVLTAIGYLLILVIVGPLVEELYFRGYLLPRLARFGGWAPTVNVGLFALYHLWKPWDAVTLVVQLLPMGYAVWRTRDIRIGIAVHIGLNGLGFLLNAAPRLLAG